MKLGNSRKKNSNQRRESHWNLMKEIISLSVAFIELLLKSDEFI